MGWSWRIGRIAGIRVFIHATFLLLIVWIGVAQWMRDRDLAASAAAVAFVLALFACVVLHELGHALTARRYGIKTRDITLLPIGGVARLERMPDEPKQELWVALAGPAVNVAIAAVLFGVLLATGGPQPLAGTSATGGPFLERLLVMNVFLAAFNMLPAFPMDGGRVVRALLATRLDYTRATQIAATLGQGMALAFGLLGLFTNPMLLFIALFVWIGAAQETHMAQVRTALSGIPVGRAMMTEFHALSPADPLSRAVEVMLQSAQQDFPVVEDGRVVGVLTRTALLAALTAKGESAPVREAMTSEFCLADPLDMLESAFSRLQERDCSTLPVVRGGRLVGLVTLDNIGELMMVRNALQTKRATG